MADQVDQGCQQTLLIHGDGNFNSRFQDDLKLGTVSRPVAVVSIFGVQSTGKSTLMNYLQSTNFEVMDASKGMHQTTKGIWVARCPSPDGDHEILALDTEGCDGSEREDDTKFEKQTALFTLAVSNTVIINMKCFTVNLSNGGNRPLLRTVFEVMIRKFCTPRKVNLVFVLRDKNKCPLPKLEEQLKGGLYKIWEGIKKPEAQVNASLEDFFNIKVEPLSNFEDKPEQFKDEVAGLREWIISNSISDEVAAGNTPASGFADYAKKIWDKIKEDEDLELPSYRIMVAEIRCNKIAEEKYRSFCDNTSWLKIEREATSGAVHSFGARISSIIDIHLSQYDEEAQHYDETKRDASRLQLIDNILKVVHPTYLSVLERMRQAILENFVEDALGEFRRKGVLVVVKVHNYVAEFRNQLKDVVVKQAHWNRDTEQLNQLESDLAHAMEVIRCTSERVEENKGAKLDYWISLASRASHIVLGVVTTFAMFRRGGAPWSASPFFNFGRRS